METSRITIAALFCTFLLVASFMHTQAAISCSTAVSDLAPCLTYLQKGGSPSSACCSGVKSLKSAAATTADRQTACNCLKSQAAQINPLPSSVSALPGKCGVSLGYSISTSTDCSKIT